MEDSQGYFFTLHVLKSDVCSYIREKCSSFVRMASSPKYFVPTFSVI